MEEFFCSTVEKMIGGAVDERESADATPPSPCKQQTLESEPIKLLRDTKFSDLFPTKDTANEPEPEPEPHTEGSAALFVKKLWRQHLNKPLSSQRKEKFLCWEIQFFLKNKGLDKFGEVDSHTIEMLPCSSTISFEEKDWHFNTSNNVAGDKDAYKLLCLGSRGKVDDPIADYYNQVGSTLCSDLSYGDFCSLVFAKLRWGDTEYEGFNKAIELKNRHYPEITDLLIPCVLHDWTTYLNDLYRYYRLIDLHYELWNKVEKGGKFPEVLSELKHKEYASIECDGVESDFHSIRKIVSRRQHEIMWGKTVLFQIAEYFVKMKPVKLSDRGYSLYVKKKIKKATQLGIIKKEDVDLETWKNF